MSDLRRQAVLLCVMLVAALPARCDEWPLPFHDSANTAISTEKIEPPLKLMWKLRWDGSEAGVVQQMVVYGGRLYLADLERVLALDLRTRAKVWEVPGHWQALCIYQDRVIAAGHDWRTGKDHQVAAFDAGTGRELWRAPSEGNGSGGWGNFSVTTHQGRLYLCGARFDELDPSSGKVLRSASPEVWMMGLPVFFDEHAYLGGAHYGYVVDLSDLSCKRLSLWDPGDANPIWWRDRIYVQGPINSAQALRLSDGKAERVLSVYGYKGTGHVVAPVDDGLLVERDAATGAYLVAYDAVTGEPRWRSPMIVDAMASGTGELVFVVGEHRLRDQRGRPKPEAYSCVFHVLEAKTGKVRWQYRFPDGDHVIEGTVPVIADGHVVVATSGGVYCFAGR